MNGFTRRICTRCGYEVDIEGDCHFRDNQCVCTTCCDKEIAAIEADNKKMRELLERVIQDEEKCIAVEDISEYYAISDEHDRIFADIRAALAEGGGE